MDVRGASDHQDSEAGESEGGREVGRAKRRVRARDHFWEVERAGERQDGRRVADWGGVRGEGGEWKSRVVWGGGEGKGWRGLAGGCGGEGSWEGEGGGGGSVWTGGMGK